MFRDAFQAPWKRFIEKIDRSIENAETGVKNKPSTKTKARLDQRIEAKDLAESRHESFQEALVRFCFFFFPFYPFPGTATGEPTPMEPTKLTHFPSKRNRIKQTTKHGAW